MAIAMPTVNAKPGRVTQSAVSDSDWLTLSIPSRNGDIPISFRRIQRRGEEKGTPAR